MPLWRFTKQAREVSLSVKQYARIPNGFASLYQEPTIGTVARLACAGPVLGLVLAPFAAHQIPICAVSLSVEFSRRNLIA
jgi:hypothetical protein